MITKLLWQLLFLCVVLLVICLAMFFDINYGKDPSEVLRNEVLLIDDFTAKPVDPLRECAFLNGELKKIGLPLVVCG